MSSEDNVKTIEAVYEAFGRGDIGLVASQDWWKSVPGRGFQLLMVAGGCDFGFVG